MTGKTATKCITKRMQYSKESVKKAVAAVNAGMTIRSASIKFGVPRSTLRSKINHSYSDKKPGPPSILSADQEDELVDWIITSSQIGHPVTKSQLINSVSLIVQKLNIANPFNEKGPGRSWYKSFLRRHEEVTVHIARRASQHVKVSDEDLKKWYETIGSYLKENDLESLGPERIWNTGEMELPLNLHSENVQSNGDEQKEDEMDCDKEKLTILVTGNAAGELAPNVSLFPDKKFPENSSAAMPPGWICAQSEQEWTEGKTFYNYICSVFLPFIKNKVIELPIILYVSNVSRLTQPLSEFCHRNKIILINLNADLNETIHPMFQSFFNPLRIAWQKIVNQNDECLNLMSKANVVQVLKKTFDTLDKRKILKTGFRLCGLFPFSSDVIKYEQVLKNNESKKFSSETAVDQASKTYFLTVLYCIENQMEADQLETFRSAFKNTVWTGAIEDTNLFYLWKKIHLSANVSPEEVSKHKKDNIFEPSFDDHSNSKSNNDASEISIDSEQSLKKDKNDGFEFVCCDEKIQSILRAVDVELTDADVS